MYAHVVKFMDSNNTPWYNKNIISIEGVSNSEDVEEYVSSEFIQVTTIEIKDITRKAILSK